MIPEGYKIVPPLFLEAQEPLKLSIHLLMPLNKSVVLFRNKSEELSLTDVLTLNKTPTRVLTPNADYAAAMGQVATELGNGIQADGTVGAPAQAVAKTLVKNLTGTPAASPADTQTAAQALLDDSTQLIAKVLKLKGTAGSGRHYEEFLKSVGTGSDPLVTHNRHVSALAALLMLTLDSSTILNVSDIAFAGLAHDLCLNQMPTDVLNAHLAGEDAAVNSAKKTPHTGEHIDLALHELRNNKALTDGAKRIITQHHENFDGTGPKSASGNAIYFPARLLRIVDDLIAIHNAPKNPRTIPQILALLRAANGHPYDPVLLEKVQACFGT